MSTQPLVTPGSGGTPGSSAFIFNSAYYASWPVLKQALYNNRAGSPTTNVPALSAAARLALCAQCIQNGIAIDEEIDYDPDVDPYTTQKLRKLVYGQNWEPCGTLDSMSTGVVTEGEYSGAPPVGVAQRDYLIVSYDPASYPPFPIPAAPPAVVPSETKAANPVGAMMIPEVPASLNHVGDIFRCAVANDGYPTDGTGQWTGSVVSGSITYTGTWTKTALEMATMIVWTKTA